MLVQENIVEDNKYKEKLVILRSIGIMVIKSKEITVSFLTFYNYDPYRL